ncbi:MULTISPECIES: GNAT family N-acetyltransferase [unclassified Streptomyces]|uniref:GNAT family N-acetyltransferase n=1 Tax=Streptomyces sp. SID4945 TaxID=2690285 RepID=UPI00081DCD59|nr:MULTISPECIES: GNAT family N-acetyltransferase [unclassified Streptomyces]SCE99463.1 Ribosomal protein S18 acetylase RimI [Streptomyces sp. LcepLS]
MRTVVAGDGTGTSGGADIVEWALRAATAADLDVLVEIRAEVMRPDLERLGRYDAHRVRQRLRDSFAPAHTSAILCGGALAGCVTFRPAEDGGHWLEHFYLAPRHQGRGLGGAVLRSLLGRADAGAVSLHVLRGSAAQRLYARHGFAVEDEGPVDVLMVRPADGARPEAAPATPEATPATPETAPTTPGTAPTTAQG